MRITKPRYIELKKMMRFIDPNLSWSSALDGMIDIWWTYVDGVKCELRNEFDKYWTYTETKE